MKLVNPYPWILGKIQNATVTERVFREKNQSAALHQFVYISVFFPRSTLGYGRKNGILFSARHITSHIGIFHLKLASKDSSVMVPKMHGNVNNAWFQKALVFTILKMRATPLRVFSRSTNCNAIVWATFDPDKIFQSIDRTTFTYILGRWQFYLHFGILETQI